MAYEPLCLSNSGLIIPSANGEGRITKIAFGKLVCFIKLLLVTVACTQQCDKSKKKKVRLSP
jgi:hypothetical protein